MLLEQEFYREFKRVAFNKKIPEFSGLLVNVGRLRKLGVFPLSNSNDLWCQMVLKANLCFAIFNLIAEIVPLGWGINDPLVAAEVFLEGLGSFLITFKLYHYQKEADAIIELVTEMETVYQDKIKVLESPMRNRVRWVFVEFYVICNVSGYILSLLLIVSTIFVPVFTSDQLPLITQYPWNAYESARSFYATFFLQFISFSSRIFMIAQMDALGIGIIHYSNVFFEILCEKIKTCGSAKEDLAAIIAEHQFLISLTKRINRIFQAPYIVQIVASLVMFCFSGVQVVLGLAESNFTIVSRFLVVLLSAFVQVAVWCYNGNKIFWTVRNSSVFIKISSKKLRTKV